MQNNDAIYIVCSDDNDKTPRTVQGTGRTGTPRYLHVSTLYTYIKYLLHNT